MSTDRTAFGDRMKSYEAATRLVLPRRTYTLVRCDGRAFHSYLAYAQKPYDGTFAVAMNETAVALCEEMSGTVFAYVQSDEISVLLTDFGSVHSEPWFGGVVQKMASIAAATATAYFGRTYEAHAGRIRKPPLFDARVFTIPDPVEVANYFIWRQRDCTRNSVAMAAQAHFSHKRLHGLSGDEMQELLFQEKGVNWAHYPAGFRNGRVVTRVTEMKPVTYTDKRTGEEHSEEALRSWWFPQDAPRFSCEAGSFLPGIIPALPRLAQ